MKSFINKFDLYSPKPEIKVDGNPKFTTKFGIFVGISSIIILACIYTFYIYDFLTRQRYTITYNEKNIIPQINLNNNKFSLSVFDGYGKDFPEENRLFSISARYQKTSLKDISKMDEDYLKNADLGKIIDLPLKKCNKFKDENLKEYFNLINLLKPNSLCLELDDFDQNLFGRYGSVDK